MTSVRESTIELLRSLGLTTIFGNPGSTELPMFRDFPADFRYVLGLQESVVVAMADGFAQSTRNAALVNLHSSAGVGHALGNIFTAYRNQTPLVVTAGQQARAILGMEPFLFAEQATEFPKPFVKWSCEPARAEDVPAALARAYQIAMHPPCGPVFVSIPVDDWDREGAAFVAPRTTSRRVAPDPVMIDAAAHALGAAQRPVIVAGAGASRDDAWDELIALAERHNAPVWAAPMSARNAFPEDHRLFAGFLPASREGIVARLAKADLILVLGAPAFTYHTEGSGPFLPPGSELIQIVDNPGTASWTPSGTAITGNLKLAIEDLLAGPAPIVRASPEPRRPAEAPAPDRLTDRLVLARLAALRDPAAIVVEEAPSSRPPMQDHLPIMRHNGFYTCASGGLGHGLPAAVGVALGRPGERVIALLGDGSAMYAVQGLWTAAQLKLPITFVILNNQRYQALVDFGEHFGLGQPEGTDLSGLDFCSLAAGQGIKALRVREADKLDAALSTALASDGPFLLEVIID